MVILRSQSIVTVITGLLVFIYLETTCLVKSVPLIGIQPFDGAAWL